MKFITVKNLLSVPMLDGYCWDFISDSVLLRLQKEEGGLTIEFELLDYGLPAFSGTEERYQWCHEWLVDYLRDVIGPPFTSNLAEVQGDTWVGWQAITSLGDGKFAGTRCLVANNSPIAIRINFSVRRDSSTVELIEILENVSFAE